MGTGTFRSLPCHPVVGSGATHCPSVKSYIRRHELGFLYASLRRSFLCTDNMLCRSSRTIVFAKKGDSSDHRHSEEEMDMEEDELLAAKRALADAKARRESIERERDRLFAELAMTKAKQKENIDAMIHEKEVAFTELDSEKSRFNQKMQDTANEKSALESSLVLAKQESVELAVQVEKFAEMSFTRATSDMLESAQQRVIAAETKAAEAAQKFEEQVRNAAESKMLSFVEQSKDVIEKALVVAERAGDYALNAVSVFNHVMNPRVEIASFQSENSKLQDVISGLESQLLLKRSEANELKLELEQIRSQANESELRADKLKKTMIEFQESSGKKNLEQEEEIKLLLVKMKEDAEEEKRTVTETFKDDLENVMTSIEAAKGTACSRDDAYVRRCEALHRSLRASEEATNVWKRRAEMAESLLLKETPLDEGNEDSIYMINAGRIDLLTDDESLKWKLLTEGPRREIPPWMARKIRSTRFPPRKVDASEALTYKFRTLDLPNANEVWSIAREKPKEGGDMLIEHDIEKETLEKKREDLERALQRKTIQLQKTPEEKKLS